MTKSEYAFSLLLQRAAGGVIAAENTKQNGLLRANRNVIFTEYARRNKTFRDQRSAYDSMRKEDVTTSSRVAPQEFSCPGNYAGTGFFINYNTNQKREGVFK